MRKIRELLLSLREGVLFPKLIKTIGKPMKRTTLKLSDIVISDGENVIHCPSCNCANLHHESVEIFNRSADSNDGTHVHILGHEVKTDRDLKSNPSLRRHGLIIHFRCEMCNAKILMKLYQHKGNTFVGMAFEEDE